MGGQWDEWYATFSNGWLGWLAEAQGRFYLTFQYPIPEGVTVPQFDQLQLGQSVSGLPWPTPLMVAETGRATARGAKGEIPYLLTPGETYYYADLFRHQRRVRHARLQRITPAGFPGPTSHTRRARDNDDAHAGT
jgi:hypothetical protein